ncbi:MAG: endonuclease/exonuclease/phosphatase family protein [Pseudonocardia sp.]|nr:endonuclease/exonuclease/phosphatase family protein [Pseudonocardia sp.]
MSLMVAILTALASLVTVPVSQAGSIRALTVLTFNIHHGAGADGVVDLDRLAAEIAATGADVVTLQEVDRHYGERTSFVDQPVELAARLGMAQVFAPNYVLEPPAPGAPPREHGTVILSRFPIVGSTQTLLPKAVPEEEQRGLLEAVLDVDGTAVRVLTTHLEPGDTPARLLQAQAVAAVVERSAEPVVLTGDLNATPDAPEITTLTSILADSHTSGAGFTYPVEAPAVRIDYVLAQGRFERSEVLGTASSDHRPLLARVLVGVP